MPPTGLELEHDGFKEGLGQLLTEITSALTCDAWVPIAPIGLLPAGGGLASRSRESEPGVWSSGVGPSSSSFVRTPGSMCGSTGAPAAVHIRRGAAVLSSSTLCSVLQPSTDVRYSAACHALLSKRASLHVESK